MLARFWQTVLNPDFRQHMDADLRKISVLTHQLSCVALLATTVLGIFTFIIGKPGLGWLNFSFVPLYASATWLNWKGNHKTAKTVLVLVACLAVFIVSSTQGRSSGNNLLYLPIFCGIFVLFPSKDRVSFFLHLSIPLACLITLEATKYSLFLSPQFVTQEASPFLINFCVCVFTFWLCINYLSRINRITEATLRESETNLLAVIENTNDSIWSIDETGKILTWNSTFQAYFHSVTGVKLATGLELAAYLPPEKKPFWADVHARAYGGERFITEIHQILGKEDVHLEISVNPIVKATGRISGISFIAKNITERKLAEEKLRFHAGILANVHDAVVGLDNEYRITYWNEGAELQYGWKEEEILGKKLREAYTFQWLNAEQKADALESLRQTGQSRTEMIQFLKTGERIYVDITTQLWYDEMGNSIGLLALIRNITQAKQAQKDSKHQSSLLKVILDNMPVILYRITSDGIIRESWGAGLKTLQHRENESAGKSIYALYPQITPALMATASEQLITFETSGNTDGQVWHFENFLFSSDNNRLICFAQDITERKKAEDEMRRINFELDSFVYRSSHDLRAPLRSLLGLTNLLRTEKEEEQQNLYLNLIDKSVNKLDTFIADMTNFSRNSRQVLSIEPVDFDKIIKDCAENLRYMDHADRVSLRMNIQMEAPFHSDVLRISTVLQNLISNSVKYQRTNIEDAYVQFDIHCDEHRALIVYSDNGKGIDSIYLDKVFDMFFRASVESYGSGLGLYIVKQVVEKLQGEIKTESVLSQGTTFTISLPNLEVHHEDIADHREEQLG